MRKMELKQQTCQASATRYVSDYTYDPTVSREHPSHYLEKTAARVPLWLPFSSRWVTGLSRMESTLLVGRYRVPVFSNSLVAGGIVLVLASAAPSWLILKTTALKKYRPYRANAIASRKPH
jgi:hypothetical protein